MTDHSEPREGWYIIERGGRGIICGYFDGNLWLGRWADGEMCWPALPLGCTLGPRIDDLMRDAGRYRWLRMHGRQITSDTGWETLPMKDAQQKEFTDQVIDAGIAKERADD